MNRPDLELHEPSIKTCVCRDCGKEVETKLVRHFARLSHGGEMVGVHRELLSHPPCKRIAV